MGIEVISKRTMFSKTFDDGNGLYTLESNMHPIHYLDQTNQWNEIDLSIKPVNTYEFTNAVLENTFRAFFYDNTNANNHLVSMEIAAPDGTHKWVNFKLKDSLTANISAQGNKFTFIDCFNGVDVEYVVDEHRLKENIILKQKVSMTNFVFTLKTGGIKVSNDSIGNVVFRCNLTNEIVFTIDKPYMLDANGVRSEGVSYVVGNDGVFDTITVVVNDTAFLNNAVYPVLIDPTLNVVAGNTSTNYKSYRNSSGNTGAYAGYHPTTYDVGDTSGYNAIHFTDLDAIKSNPNNVYVKALISIYVLGQHTNAYGARFLKIENNWSESAATLPVSSGKLIYTYYNNKPTNSWFDIDISSYIDSLFNGLYCVGDQTYYGSSTWFGAPDNANAAIRPKLTLQYYSKPALIFHDGTTPIAPYADDKGGIFKYLDFGTMIAGQTSLIQKVYLRNLNGYSVINMKVWIDNPTPATGVTIEISKSNSPFIAETILSFSGTITDGSDVSFFVRVISNETATAGNNFLIMTKASPA